MQKLCCVHTRQHPLPVWSHKFVLSSLTHFSTNSRPFLMGIVSRTNLQSNDRNRRSQSSRRILSTYRKIPYLPINQCLPCLIHNQHNRYQLPDRPIAAESFAIPHAMNRVSPNETKDSSLGKSYLTRMTGRMSQHPHLNTASKRCWKTQWPLPHQIT